MRRACAATLSGYMSTMEPIPHRRRRIDGHHVLEPVKAPGVAAEKDTPDLLGYKAVKQEEIVVALGGGGFHVASGHDACDNTQNNQEEE